MKIVYVIENQDFCLLETHLDVQGDPSLFPQTKKGNPKPGHFAFGEEDLDCVYSWSTGIVDLPESFTPGNPIYIAAHAVVLEYVSYDPVIINTETAWAGDEDFPGKNWAAYFMCQ